MTKPRPIELHVNSFAKNKYLKFQEIIHSENQYYFCEMDGKKKTEFFNRGLIDGRRHGLLLKGGFFHCENVLGVLAIKRCDVDSYINEGLFTGVISLDKTYLIQAREADSFIQNYCLDCEVYGEAACYANFACGEEDRDRFKESSWFELQKAKRKERKSNIAFPG
ncbi:hypothetical protein [Paenibacillus sp. Leaf72]|uniref:hypothetical protein n=1 Tax=Paenibacillus sp. Leaf72 TaxID=1736234 RepID=UPI0006FDE3A2|nr:hypothetical protein [Paenibacillus sp. Leaf72]KQN96816.1 hypothetical protein ASF12_22350 [Paenibacillus sp. Leaf72]